MNKIITTTLALAACTAASLHAQLQYDKDVTPDAIFGSGNANGSYTVERANGVEIGLRGKLRFDSNNQPQNIFNSNGAGTYTFLAGTPPSGFGFALNSPTTPVWNFEWSVNTDWDGSSGLNLNDFTYEIGLDSDPSAATLFTTFDPITPTLSTPAWDHSIGDNSTGNGAGTEASDPISYGALLADNNVAQNSWSYEFFNDAGPLAAFDPNVAGEYTIYLKAFDGNGLEVAGSEIVIEVVPEPSALVLVGFGALALLLIARRR